MWCVFIRFLQRRQTSSVSADPALSYRVKIFDGTLKRSPYVICTCLVVSSFPLNTRQVLCAVMTFPNHLAWATLKEGIIQRSD